VLAYGLRYDHGMFVPLMLMWPKLDVPVNQLSILSSLNAADHFKLGEALAPLRKEGVLIIGSGMSYHGFFYPLPSNVTAADASKAFDEYLQKALVHTGKKRKEALENWKEAKHALVAHPRSEHLMPLLVAAGAAKDDKVKCIYHTKDYLTISAFQFGD